MRQSTYPRNETTNVIPFLGGYEQFRTGPRVFNQCRVVRGHSPGNAGSTNLAMALSEIDLSESLPQGGSCMGLRVLCDLFRRSLRYDLASGATSFRP